MENISKNKKRKIEKLLNLVIKPRPKYFPQKIWTIIYNLIINEKFRG